MKLKKLYSPASDPCVVPFNFISTKKLGTIEESDREHLLMSIHALPHFSPRHAGVNVQAATVAALEEIMSEWCNTHNRLKDEVAKIAEKTFG